jgi:uncharacterized membrane protein
VQVGYTFGMESREEEHTLKRLEAFSDIVIGFCLAEMTLNLTVPSDALALFTSNSIALYGFGVTFLVVCGLWWSHHRLFARYFVPTPLNIALNFLVLGGIMFLVYSLQVAVHDNIEHHWIAQVMYLGAIAWVLAINAYLTFDGARRRAGTLNPELVRTGLQKAIQQSILALFFAALALNQALTGASTEVHIGMVLTAISVVVLLFSLWRVLNRWLKDPGRSPSGP